eukprot:2305689-Alexandrium_andersonii.AAC.1
MSRQKVGVDKYDKPIYKPAINVPSGLVPMAPEGASDPGAYYLQQAFRTCQDYPGCLLAHSSPDAQ